LRRENARQYERIRHDFADVEVEDIVDSHQDLDTSTEAYVLRQALSKLNEDYREPLVLQVLGGFSCDEIAQQLGLTKTTVMTRLFRARQTLREMLIGNDQIETEVRKL
jgi:RNA polymerase sigma-70 factor (ECF subfamily)